MLTQGKHADSTEKNSDAVGNRIQDPQAGTHVPDEMMACD